MSEKFVLWFNELKLKDIPRSEVKTPHWEK